MPQTFAQDVVIDGSADAKQLRVQGHTTQTNPLETWEDSAGNTLAQVTGDGRLQVGDDVGLSSPDALIEAHRHEDSTTKPKRGFHALGRISGTLNSVVQWMVAELELRGSGVISAVHSALRVKATNLNTGTPATGAELRGVEVEIVNDATASAGPLPKATGIQVGITTATGKQITDGAGIRIKHTLGQQSDIPNLYSIFMEGLGPTHFDDYLEFKYPPARTGLPTGQTIPQPPTTTPPTPGLVRLYTRNDQLYAANQFGEMPLGGRVLLKEDVLQTNNHWDIDLTTLPDGQSCEHLELIVLVRTNTATTSQWVNLLFNNDTTLTNYRSSIIYNSGNTSLALVSLNQAYAVPVSAANSPANSFGFTRIFIPFYRQTLYRHLSQFTSAWLIDDTTTGFVSLRGTHLWTSTAAINRIQIRADNHPTNLLVTNSRLQIIGYKY